MWPNLMQYHGTFLEIMTKITKILRQGSQIPGWGFDIWSSVVAMTLCILLHMYQRFGRPWYLHLHCERSKASVNTVSLQQSSQVPYSLLCAPHAHLPRRTALAVSPYQLDFITFSRRGLIKKKKVRFAITLTAVFYIWVFPDHFGME